jgi:RHS repeat-associated protein
LTADLNKGISTIAYNYLGKPSKITFSDGRVIDYTYDAAGTKLKMVVTQGGNTTTTDYVGSFVYENNALSFFGSPEGRVVKNGSNLEYQYSIADNQGNTRVVFTSATPAADAPVATFEGDGGDGASQYLNVDPSNVVTFIGANHTSGGSKVLRMNQTYKTGAAKSVKVYPGDNIDIEAWEYHEGSSGFGTSGSTTTALITAVAGTFGGVTGGAGESGMIYNGVDDAITTFGAGQNQGDAAPAAFLNYILFDKNYAVLDAGWLPAPATTFTKQKIAFPTKTIKEEGYMFVWLSYDNESNNWVYFDDLKVTHMKTNVIQYSEYYPFGLQTDASWTRNDVTDNRYLYNAANELNKTTGWYEMLHRGYDPTTGRFLQIDPMAAIDPGFSPYVYAGDNPIFYNDPLGLWKTAMDVIEERNDKIEAAGGVTSFGNAGGGGFSRGYMQRWSDAVDREVEASRNQGNENSESTNGSYTTRDRNEIAAIIGTIKENDGKIQITSENGELGYLDGYVLTEISPDPLGSDGLAISTSYHTRFVAFRARAQQGGGIIKTYLEGDILTNLGLSHAGATAWFTYEPSASDNKKYVKYDWLVLQTFNGSPSIVEKYVGDNGPYYNSSDGGGASFLDNAFYDYNENPTMEYYARATVFGFKANGDALQIGTVTYGFTYKDGTVTLIQPTITYKRK